MAKKDNDGKQMTDSEKLVASVMNGNSKTASKQLEKILKDKVSRRIKQTLCD